MALFGIKRIQYCKATQLAFSGQNNPFLGIASEPTNTFTDVVCMINSRATLTIEQAVVNKQIVYTAKLQFVTPADPMLDVDHYAFIATTNEGERILLGANTRPQVAVVTAQGVFGNAGELTAYTTTAEFKADYRPLRLPVTAAEPISGPAYDICCGQIPQPQPADNREFTIKGGAIAPENEPADNREFDICCGQIKTSEPISGPAYDVCCGEIVGSPTMLTVIWQNYDGTEVDRATYPEGSPEPTTSVVPTRPGTSAYRYVFNGWVLYSQTVTVKIYRADYTAVPYTIVRVATVTPTEPGAVINEKSSTDGKRVTQYSGSSTQIVFREDEFNEFVALYITNPEVVTAVDWNEAILPTQKTWIYKDGTDVKIGYYIGNNQPTTDHALFWEKNDGTADGETWNFYVGKAIYPPTTPPTREGYNFIGWSNTRDGQPVSDYGIMPDNNKAFWAVWQAI